MYSTDRILNSSYGGQQQQAEAGRQHGEWQYFSTDGMVEQIEHYDGGVATGLWQRFNSQQQVIETTQFERGEKTKVSRFYDNGKTRSVETYQNSLRHGVWQTFHLNGQVAHVASQWSGIVIAQMDHIR